MTGPGERPAGEPPEHERVPEQATSAGQGPVRAAGVRGGLTVGVLGVLEVAVDGRPVPLTTGKLRTLLVVLAMSASATVSMKRLAEAVWSDAQPRHSRRCLQIYAARLREALGREWIETRQDGLLLRAGPDAVDALRFERALDRAAAERGCPRERELIQDALTLWRGQPFDGVSSRWLEEIQAPRLTERHLTALERRAELDILAGRAGDAVADLSEQVSRHPMRESLCLRLLVALDRCGRQAEALRWYGRVRAVIARELGVEPNRDLRRAHADLLAGRPLDAPGAVPAAGQGRWSHRPGQYGLNRSNLFGRPSR
ncbi:DNA-binding SARP family transcriptional activator [Nonomuraea thailandensis]|uniref:DNA-binding SARP family transcriptional activator n=1 Tax=Nonomuraea thailandensis TaxID=1188745 RepID=A0A9X2GDD2_9ACTN|nr:AfsR/SARP family transcriptional regulator [Nonomuraea thailandensis]MCP2355710.1 DNA-binding SARP family transcriptional activator [Nonomuraea thailandensis]